MSTIRRAIGDDAAIAHVRRSVTWRRSAPVVALSLVLFASCGSDDAGDSAPVTSPSPTTVASVSTTPVTTTQVTTPPVTSPPTTAPVTTPPTTAPATTSPVTSPPTTASAPTTTVDVVVEEYASVEWVTPIVDGATDPITNPLPDGVYWSWTYAPSGDSVEFVLSQLFTGEACRERFGDSPEACASDNNTVYEPSATVMLTPGAGSATVLMSREAAGFERLAVSTTEFSRLVAGETPAEEAPAGFVFDRHAVVIVIDGGEIDTVDQVFMS